METVAFGLREGEVSGISIDVELVDYEDIDTVTLYLNPKRQKEYYDYVLSLNPKRVIFNPGTENPEFYSILKENNIATLKTNMIQLVKEGITSIEEVYPFLI